MNQQLNAAFVAEHDGDTAFFLWLTNSNGSFARKYNSALKSQLGISIIWRRLIENDDVRQGTVTLEKENGSVKTDGLFIPMEAMYDLLLDSRYFKQLPPWISAGPSCRFFEDIAQAVAILVENGHYRPDLLIIDKGGLAYVSAHWILEKSLLDKTGLISEWLHHIPEEVLAPEIIAQQSLSRWLTALLDTWADKMIRRMIQPVYQPEIEDWPNHQFYDSDWAEWFYFLVNGNGGYYQWTQDPAVYDEYVRLQKQIRFFSDSQNLLSIDKALTEFKASYISERIEPLVLGLRFDPADRQDPFLPNGEWEFDIIIEGIKGLTKETEWYEAEDVLKREPALEAWMNERIRLVKEFSPWLRDEDLLSDSIMISTDKVLDLYKHRDFLMEHDVVCLFPEWMKIKDRRNGKVQMNVSVGTNGGAFSFDSIVNFNWRLSLGEYDISTQEFERLVREQQRFIRRGDEWVELPLDQLNAVYAHLRSSQTTLKKEAKLSDALRLSLTQKGLEDEDITVDLAPNVEDFLQSIIKRPDKNIAVPGDLKGELRPYQKRGYTWLAHLQDKGVGGCLADDMGLGKTIQTITYLLRNKENLPEHPALIVCPTSVIGNWAQEIEKFAPSLKVYVHHGTNRLDEEAFQEQRKHFDIVITSYTLTVKDAVWMREVEWSSLILDEAQAIKNPAAKKSQQLRRFQAQHRIALTGTPIENRLEELWSIMDFLNPGYLGSLTAFRREFINPIESKHDEGKAQLLKRLIQPFLLRREKTDKRIIRDLPDKDELKIYCHLSEEQASLYQSVVDHLMTEMASAKGIQRKGLILSTLTKLKQVCNHPSLLTRDDNVSTASGKMEKFLKLLAPIIEDNESALVFTQYVRMGDLLKKVIQKQFPGCPVYFLNGSVPMKKRDEMIKAFQSEQGKGVFILSLKAGGFGLNLTNANHVIHYDRWWNPAVEEQATDRTYRIGQKRDVHVYKLISEGTLEKRIDDLIEKKKGLAYQILGSGESWVTEMDDQQILDLIRLRERVLA
ncbi:MAG: DEAD/DEAH box helicase [Tuberibacillus sp.]